jgi:transporter family-2 protein
MTLAVILALVAGLLVSVSRQINGRLALSTSALGASFWNHAVGLGLLLAAGLALGGLWPEGTADAPWFAWIGGPVGVIFVASGSWLIARIGAVNTALLVIGGQMVSGVALDLWRAAPGDPWLRAGGVALILAGMALLQRR